MSAPEPVPALVTLHLWRVGPRASPRRCCGWAWTAAGSAAPTASGSPSCSAPATAAPSPPATPTRCAGACSPPGPTPRRPRLRATARSPAAGTGWPQERLRLDLRPVVSRGRWSGRQPFGDPVPARATDGPVAAVTRARLRRRRTLRFWSAVPPGQRRPAPLRRPARRRRHRRGPRRPAGHVQPLGQRRRAARSSPTAAPRTRRSSPAPRARAGTPRSCSPASPWSGPRARSTAGTRSRERGHVGASGTAAALRGPPRRGARRLRRRRWASTPASPGPGAASSTRTCAATACGRSPPSRTARSSASPTATSAPAASGGTTRCARPWATCWRAQWLDGSFEVCELHVRPALHGTGLGRTLLARAARRHARPHRRAHHARHRDPGPRASTGPAAGPTSSASCASPATRGPSRCSACACRLASQPRDRLDRAVVVGAGHNGLVAACYLAKAGLDVEVVERDTVVGGAVSTVERFPGYRMDRGSSAHIMVRHTGIVEDLELTRFGLEYQDLDPWGFAPSATRASTSHVDLDRTCASIESVCGSRDADAYRGVRPRLVGAQHPRVRGLPGRPDRRAPRPDAVGRRQEHRPRRAGAVPAVPHQRRQPARRALRRRAAQDRAGLDGRAVRAADPRGRDRRPGRLEHDDAPAAAGSPQGRQRDAQRGAAGAGWSRYGGRVRLGDGAAAITTSGGRATGVTLQSARTCRRRVVVSGAHVLTTLELLGRARWLDRARTRSVRTGNGIGMVVRLGHERAAAVRRRHRPRPTARCSCSPPAGRRCARPTASTAPGCRRSDPAALAMTFSAFDDTIAPPGKHNVTVWGQWHPYALSNGEHWDDIREREGTKLVEAVDRVAPGFAEQRRADARADAARPRARARPAQRAGHARRDGLRPDVHVASDARAGRLHRARTSTGCTCAAPRPTPAAASSAPAAGPPPARPCPT